MIDSLVMFLFLLFIYFIPSIVAFTNKKNNATPILVLNFFLGWTFVGWVIALVWATAKEKK